MGQDQKDQKKNKGFTKPLLANLDITLRGSENEDALPSMLALALH